MNRYGPSASDRHARDRAGAAGGPRSRKPINGSIEGTVKDNTGAALPGRHGDRHQH